MNNKISNRGFTLIEVIFSIVFFSIISLVVLRLYIAADDLNTFSQESDSASLVCSNIIEDIKTVNSTSDLSTTLNYDIELEKVNTFLVDEDFNISSEAIYEFSISLNQDSESKGLYEINVSVFSIERDTYLADYSTKHYFKFDGKE